MSSIFAPALHTVAATVFIIMAMATAASAEIKSCTPENAPVETLPPAQKTPLQLVFQLRQTMPATGILLCRDVYGLRIGNSLSVTAPKVVGLDIGLPFSVGKEVTGIHLSLIGNILLNKFSGLQLGGIYNVTNEFTGIQIAPILNIAGTDDNVAYGVQLGLINFADLRGVQAGLVNLAGTSSVQIGGVSAAREALVQASIFSNILFDLEERNVFVQLGGLIGNYATNVGLFQGIGVLNIADKLSGVQAGVVNIAISDLGGLQVGLINIADITIFADRHDKDYAKVKGVQLGLINHAESIRGLQIGFVNSAVSLKGVQIGALNINRSGPLKFMPLVNIGF